MDTHTTHLQLVFLASTVSPAWVTGWAFTATPAPLPRPVPANAAPARIRLAVVGA
ncbi:hypothetical protein Q5H92_26240 [Hymenobacter sp. M29]|uniref:Uncharacterized protein n=1 Tax=Hymenobacter mellowenesis TaxID=3063995 RepID=A0ABT9AK91_9BACT|nr:hypothetical protein [Hymenobacter sp. M29]MDO7849887.1 hypothetical protein [Hymenobacter sp. M29]